jgi:hypothetical protein
MDIPYNNDSSAALARFVHPGLNMEDVGISYDWHAKAILDDTRFDHHRSAGRAILF